MKCVLCICLYIHNISKKTDTVVSFLPVDFPECFNWFTQVFKLFLPYFSSEHPPSIQNLSFRLLLCPSLLRSKTKNYPLDTQHRSSSAHPSPSTARDEWNNRREALESDPCSHWRSMNPRTVRGNGSMGSLTFAVTPFLLPWLFPSIWFLSFSSTLCEQASSYGPRHH